MESHSLLQSISSVTEKGISNDFGDEGWSLSCLLRYTSFCLLERKVMESESESGLRLLLMDLKTG